MKAFPSVLELFAIPYTGSSSYTTAVCLRKYVVNGILDRAGLPIPRFTNLRRGSPLVSVGYPAICKPAAEDASLGIEQRSVVRNMRSLDERGRARAEIKEFPSDHRFATTKGSDNIIAFTTNRYARTPLVVQGPGAGADVTAMGVFSDIFTLLHYLPH